MIPFALLSAAFAGSIYINGVRADVLPEITLSNATVRFDAQGNVWIDAPGYRVQVLPPTEYAQPATPAPPAPPAPTAAPRVQTGIWWLVTEDNGSTGQVVDVLVNGVLARRINSGDPQIILDLAPWLKPGANTVSISPTPGTQGGGALNVYVGRGSNVAGTIHLDNPDVVYSRRASDTGGAKQYTLTVP